MIECYLMEQAERNKSRANERSKYAACFQFISINFVSAWIHCQVSPDDVRHLVVAICRAIVSFARRPHTCLDLSELGKRQVMQEIDG